MLGKCTRRNQPLPEDPQPETPGPETFYSQSPVLCSQSQALDLILDVTKQVNVMSEESPVPYCMAGTLQDARMYLMRGA